MPSVRMTLVLALSCLFLSMPVLAGPPPSRVEAVLDLSTPEAAVRTYSDAYAADDFIAVYFSLAPAARDAFLDKVSLFMLDDVVSAEADYSEQIQVVDGGFGPYEHQAPDAGSPIFSNDLFQVFQTVLWSADRLGLHAVDFAGAATVASVGEPVEGDGPPQVTVEASDAIAGPVRFLLRQSPAGRWRVLSVIARPGAPDEAVFLPLDREP